MEVSFKRKTNLENVLHIYQRIPPDRWREMSDEAQADHIAKLEQRLDHARRTFGYYQDCCRELGYGDGTLVFNVWVGTEPDAMDDHVRQMQKAVREKREYLASMPASWGTW